MTDGSASRTSSRRPTPSRSSSTNFEGPLDLLLHLIKKNEVNIHDIPIALITAQYLDAIALMQELESRRRRRVPRDGGDADSHQVEDAAAAAGNGRRRRRRGGRSARRARAPAARASEVQGGGRPAARARAAARGAVAAARRARSPRSPATTTSRSSKSISSACSPRFRRSSQRAKQRPKVLLPPEQMPVEAAHRAAARAAVGNRGVRLRGSVRRRRRSQRPDRHVPGAARDDSAEAGAGVPVRQLRADSRLQARRGRPMRRIRLAIRRDTVDDEERHEGRMGRMGRMGRTGWKGRTGRMRQRRPTRTVQDGDEPAEARRRRAEGDSRSADLRVARAADAEGDLQAARHRAEGRRPGGARAS